MQKQVCSFASQFFTRQLRWTLAALLAAVSLALPAAAHANGARTVAEREFQEAVQQYHAGRKAEAFGRFIALANRGDVDAARIALFMHGYGPLLYGKHWEAGREDIEYWQNLVRNSSAASVRAQPDFVPLAVAPAKGKARQVRTAASAKMSTVAARGD